MVLPVGNNRAGAYPVPGSDPAATLGEFIRRQRELSELSMREFANLAGISNPYLSQIERGLRAPSEQVLRAIAATLNTSAEALYEQAGVRSPDDRPSEVVEAIRADPNLTARQRQALLEVYQAFVVIGARPRRSRTKKKPEAEAES